MTSLTDSRPFQTQPIPDVARATTSGFPIKLHPDSCRPDATPPTFSGPQNLVREPGDFSGEAPVRNTTLGVS
jgi:hypothetical protein